MFSPAQSSELSSTRSCLSGAHPARRSPQRSVVPLVERSVFLIALAVLCAASVDVSVMFVSHSSAVVSPPRGTFPPFVGSAIPSHTVPPLFLSPLPFPCAPFLSASTNPVTTSSKLPTHVPARFRSLGLFHILFSAARFVPFAQAQETAPPLPTTSRRLLQLPPAHSVGVAAPEVLPLAAEAPVVVFTTAASIASAVFSFDPLAVAQAGRTLAVIQMAQCVSGTTPSPHRLPNNVTLFFDDQRPPFPRSLLPWLRFGDDMDDPDVEGGAVRLSWDRGTIVGNIAFVAALAAAASGAFYAVVTLLLSGNPELGQLPSSADAPEHHPVINSPMTRASRLLRFPGAPCVVLLGFALDGLVGASARLLRYSSVTPSAYIDAPLALVGLGVIVAAGVGALLLTARHVPKHARLVSVPPPVTMCPLPEKLRVLRDGDGQWIPGAKAMQGLFDEEEAMLPRGPMTPKQRQQRQRRKSSRRDEAGDAGSTEHGNVMSPAAASFVARWSQLFGVFSFNRRWFVAVEVCASIAVAAARGVEPRTPTGCRIALGLVLSVHLALLALTVVLRPFLSHLRSAAYAASAALLCLASVVGLIASLAAENGSHKSAEASASFAVIAAVPLAIPPLVALWHFIETRLVPPVETVVEEAPPRDPTPPPPPMIMKRVVSPVLQAEDRPQLRSASTSGRFDPTAVIDPFLEEVTPARPSFSKPVQRQRRHDEPDDFL